MGKFTSLIFIGIRVQNIIMNLNSLIIGHRGAKDDILENTLESILHAIELGIDGIEFDVQKCKTGEIIIFHDKTVDRLAPNNKEFHDKEIKDLTWTTLCNVNLIDKDGKIYKIPKLEDILKHPKVYNSNILIDIEIKDTFAHEETYQILTELINTGLYKKDRFLITSFHKDALLYFQNRDYKLGYIFAKMYNTEDEVSVEVDKYENILTHVVIDIKLVNNVLINKLQNYKIFVYTVNDPLKVQNYRVNGIITDNPRRFLLT